jgi:tetratricopeptide (TPR) repeat protein
MKTGFFALKALLLSAALLPVSVWAKCQISSTKLPVTMSGHRPLVTARINDARVNFIVDSGAAHSMITPAAADQLKLVRHGPPEGLRVESIGRRGDIYTTRVERVTLEKTVVPNVEFIVEDGEFGGDAVGLLGQDVLGMSDIEYDFADGVIRITRPNEDCRKTRLAYWAGAQPVAQIELERSRDFPERHTASSAYLNGAKVRVAFNSGSPVSIVSLKAAKRAGLVPGGEDVVFAGLTHGIGRNEVQTWVGPVKSFWIGNEFHGPARLRFCDIDLPDVDMLIGADFFLSHRIYVANSQDMLYFTYNGGRVFDLTTFPGALHPVTRPEDSEAPLGDDLATPTDAAGYARRGMAFASRRDFDHAIADLTRACELNPRVGKYFRQRAQVQLSLGQQVPALSDFDEALRLDPDDVVARLARARLHLSGGDAPLGRADLIAADKSAAPQADVRFDIGLLYMDLNLHEAALVQFDQWIAAHEHEPSVPHARNQRCWARALLGRELEKALEDCEAAVWSRPENAPYLDSRGVVYLRLGELDKALADFDAALRLRPRLAWSLYGRGIVRLRKGAIEAGNSDIAAAKALQPSIEDDAKRYAIIP